MIQRSSKIPLLYRQTNLAYFLLSLRSINRPTKDYVKHETVLATEHKQSWYQNKITHTPYSTHESKWQFLKNHTWLHASRGRDKTSRFGNVFFSCFWNGNLFRFYVFSPLFCELNIKHYSGLYKARNTFCDVIRHRTKVLQSDDVQVFGFSVKTTRNTYARDCALQ